MRIFVALVLLANVAGAQAPPPPSPAARMAADPRLAQADQLHEQVVAAYDAGRYAEAIPSARRALQLRESVLGPEHPSVATELNYLGLLLDSTGQSGEAESVYRRALAIDDKNPPADPSNVASHLNNLAVLLKSKKRYTEAEPLYRRALAIDEKALGPQAPELATDLSNLGALLKATGRSAEAIPLYRRALAIDDKALGADHADVIDDASKLADVLKASGHYGDAEPLYRRLLANAEKTVGPNDPKLATRANNLALVLQKLGKYAEAESLFNQALAIREKALGPESTAVAVVLSNLAALYRDIGRNAEAEPLARRALAIDEKKLGPDHPSVSTDLHVLANVLVAFGRYGEAEPLERRELAIDEKALGADHADVAVDLNDLGLLCGDTGRYEEAEAYFRRALAINEKAYGPSNHEVAATLNNLADLLDTLERAREAEPMYRRALAIDEQLLGSDHPTVALRLNNLASLLDSTDRPAEAEKMYRRALAIDEKSFGPDHPAVANVLLNLAPLLEKQGHRDEAEQMLLRAYRVSSVDGYAEDLWGAQSELSEFYATSNPSLAIFYGKQAVNTLQTLRSGLASGDQMTLKAYTRSVSAVYRHLSDLLIDQGRLPESEQVMGLLKQHEFDDYLLRDGSVDGVHSSPSFSTKEEPLASQYATINSRIVALGQERAELTRLDPASLTPAQSARLSQLDQQLDAARNEVLHFLDELNATFRQAGGQKAIDFGNKDLKSLERVQQIIADLGQHGHPTVLIHYLVTPQRLRILVTTGDAQVHRDSAIKEADLNKLVGQYRDVLQDPHLDARPLGKALYDALIAPIASDLAQAGPATLMFSLDGALRYVPMAALYDGKRWLIETHGVALFANAAGTDLEVLPQSQWRVAGLGVSLGGQVGKDHFKALPAVPRELEAIVRDDQAHTSGVLPGIERLDDTFTRDALIEAIRQGYSVLHIASHFNFRPTVDGSYLLLGNNQALTLTDFRKGSSYRLTKVDLLTLSACETAIDTVQADGSEIEGLGALAQERGAKAVMATLWSVSDATTGRFMQHFYESRQRQQLTKAEAMRAAQLAFIRGEAADSKPAPRATRSAGAATEIAEVAFHADPTKPYAHPYFWAPFILMGNWL